MDAGVRSSWENYFTAVRFECGAKHAREEISKNAQGLNLGALLRIRSCAYYYGVRTGRRPQGRLSHPPRTEARPKN
jgi:hypothetical protein